MVKQRKPNPALIDVDNPEWTATEFRRAKPADQVLPELFSAQLPQKCCDRNAGDLLP